MNTPIPFDFEHTASFDVDAQNGFTPKCPNELPVPRGGEIADALNAQATLAKYRVGSKDAHPVGAVWEATEALPQFSPVLNEPDVDIRWKRHCVNGTYGAELLAGLPKVTEYDFFVWKGMEPNLHPYGACYHDLSNRISTGVIEWLKAKGVTTVIVGGLALDYCVITTALQLRMAGFEVIINLTACRGIAAESVDAALARATEVGIHVTNLI